MKSHNISYLNVEQKKKLLNLLIAKNSLLFSQNEKSSSYLFVKNQEEYCRLLNELTLSLGIKKKPVTKKLVRNLLEALDYLASDEGDFKGAKIISQEFVLNIDYRAEAFIQDAQKLLHKISKTDKDALTGCFGFRLDENGVICGYPVQCTDETEILFLGSKDKIAAAKDLSNYVERFCANVININGYPGTQKALNAMIKVFPEFLMIIGNVQHKTHDYTLDVHILKVMQVIINEPRFSELPLKDKRLLLLAAFLHDLTKRTHHVDKSHAPQSAYTASMILDKVPIEKSCKDCIFLLIKNHDFLEKYNKGSISSEQIAQSYKTKELFKSACILTYADLHSVKEDGSFYEKYKDVYLKAVEEINSCY